MAEWVCTYPVTQREITLNCGLVCKSDDKPTHRCAAGHPPAYWDPPDVARRRYDERTGTTRHTVPASDAPVAAAPDIALAPSAPSPAPSAPPATRQRLPPERHSITKCFRLAYTHRDGTPDTMRLYVTVGLYDDGRPGEVFIKIDRMGTLAHGALDATATMISLLLQYGVPLPVVTGKLRHTRYEPAGFTKDAEFPSCTSALDLVAQWLDKRFGASSEA